MYKQLFLVLGLGLCMGGCLPLAWINPPLQVGGSVGPRVLTKQMTRPVGTPVARTKPPEPQGLSGYVFINIDPLQAFHQLFQRRFDVAVGYVGQSTLEEWAHGPQLELAVYPLRYSLLLGKDEQGRPFERSLRLGLRSLSRLWLEPVLGFTQAFQAHIEFVNFTNEGPFSSAGWSGDSYGAFVGHRAAGETGIGFYMEVGYTQLSYRSLWSGQPTTALTGIHYWFFHFGLTLRLPASFGAGFVFAPFLK